MAGPLGELPAAATTVLLASRTLVGDDGDACASLLARAASDDGPVLWVSYTRTPADCVRRVREEAGVPDRGVVVTVGESRGDGADLDPAVTVESIDSPTDLTGLGIALRRHLDEWPDGHAAICFDSLTSLLQYVDLETAYEFLQVVCGQTHHADAVAHFHLDPDAHEERTIATLTSLVDAAVVCEEEGMSVRTRFER